MAIATIERDPARGTGTTSLRFRLLQPVCGSPEGTFWRAIDRRSGKSCVVRVIDAEPEQSSRRLVELHRERTLAERIGHPGVLRADVPMIESERIFQVVDPEPAGAIQSDSVGGRLAALNLLVAVASVLAEAHAHEVFHGAFSRSSCLRGSDGRVIVQGFLGDAASAAAVRDGAAADHRAFLEFATDMLRQTGGPPPRLRRYFAQHLSEAAPKSSATAMAELSAELRESLEDTFPWPLAAQAADGAATAGPALTGPMAKIAPLVALAPDDSIHAGAAESPTLSIPNAGAGVIPTSTLPSAAAAKSPTQVALIAGAAGRSRRAKRRATNRQSNAPQAASALASVPVLRQLTASPAPAAAPVATKSGHQNDLPSHGWRPWLAGLTILLVIAATLQFASRSSALEPRSPVPTEPAAASSPPPDREARAAAGPQPADTAMRAAPAFVTQNAIPARSAATLTPARAPRAPASRDAAVGSVPAPADDSSAQAMRSRVATLVAGGNRALNALEPAAAVEAFAAALQLSPDDRAAREGSQRARRLQGVAALVRDAREATAAGDHGRAVQGYSQALANDPRNRGLAEALANSRRNLGRDANSTLLAEGHAALGAGRFEAARDAFEKALAADPLAPGVRRAAEQAAMAILLRDEAEARRTSRSVAEGN